MQQIIGLDEIPPLALRVVTDGDQVGIQGATWVASKFFDFKRLGATTTTGATTFSWEAPGKVYACTEHWSKEHVNEVLTAAVRTHMRKHNVQITVE